MTANIISSSDAGLLIHRLVTESVLVIAWFVSADRSVRIKIEGFVTSFEQEDGMVISTAPGAEHSSLITVSYDLVARATFQYSDDAEVPEEFIVGSGLRINLANGDPLSQFLKFVPNKYEAVARTHSSDWN